METTEVTELRSALLALSDRPTDAHSSVEAVKLAQRLCQAEALDLQTARPIEGVLYFIPRGPYREIQWPATWIKAARLLAASGHVAGLRRVAQSAQPVYLSAVGALCLAQAGDTSDSVRRWLKNSRDYFLMTPEERRELAKILEAIGDSAPELEKLAQLAG